MLEISSVILEICKRDVPKTRVMYMSNLNSKQMSEYIGLLERQGLVERAKSSKRVFYRTTEKGIQYIDAYRQLENVLR